MKNLRLKFRFITVLLPLLLILETCKKDKPEEQLAGEQSKGAVVKCPRVAALKEHKAEALYNVITYAGSKHIPWTPEESADGPLCDAKFSYPYGLTVSKSGNIYVSEWVGHKVKKISMDGMVSTLAGNDASGFVDGVGVNARFNYPGDLAVDKNENVYLEDSPDGVSSAYRMITTDGTVTTLPSFPPTTTANTALKIGPDGALYQGEYIGVWRTDRDFNSSRFAGTEEPGFNDGKKEDARFYMIPDLAFGPDGTLFVADRNVLREITPAGYVKTLAGQRENGTQNDVVKDGQGRQALFAFISAIAVDKDGSIYAGDFGCIRKISPEGYVSTVAGKPYEYGYKDAVGTDARFNTIDDLGIFDDYLYIMDRKVMVVRRMKIH